MNSTAEFSPGTRYKEFSLEDSCLILRLAILQGNAPLKKTATKLELVVAQEEDPGSDADMFAATQDKSSAGEKIQESIGEE